MKARATHRNVSLQAGDNASKSKKTVDASLATHV